MTEAALPFRPGRRAPAWALPLAAGGLGALAWGVLAAAAPAPAFQGWLVAFAFWSGPSVGATVLRLIAHLTGGRWGEAFARELVPAAHATPVLALLALPIPFALPWLYPWAAEPARVDASVRALFLNPAAYTLLGAAALAGWSLLARLPHRAGRLGAGLGLVFHGGVVSLVAVAAVVSVETGVTNSAAGMSLATAQLTAGLGWAALQGVDRPARSPAGDLGGLLVATALGLSYLVFMTWLVAWYGDRPNLNAYWSPRTGPGWGAVAVGALTCGLLAPATLMALRRRIGVRRALRAAGASAWAGLALYAVWLFAPTYGPACLPAAALAAAAQGGVWLAATTWTAARLTAVAAEGAPVAEAAGEPRDALEPSGVATGRVWLAVAAIFALLATSFAVIGAFTALGVHGSTRARAHAFPRPALETSVAPRRVADRGPGARAPREPPAADRASELGPPGPALLAAERAEAARGARAYDPVPAGDGR